MFKEGNHECINRLQRPSVRVLDTGLPIRSEPFEKRQSLWHEIKENSDRYKNGDCGTFLKDLHGVFSSRFDASLLVLAVAFRQNNEPFEGSAYFSMREIEAYETIERYGYFRIQTKGDIAKKIRSRDEKTLSLLQEYSESVGDHMDEILADPRIRDTIRSYLKKQWGEETKKVGDAIREAGVDLEWFASLPRKTPETEPAPQTIIINADKDSVVNLGNGPVIKDAVVTGSTVESSGGRGTTIKDSVVTKSSIGTNGDEGAKAGIQISDSVVTSSTIKNARERLPEPENERPGQKAHFICLICNTPAKPNARFCTTCGAKISRLCSSCNTALAPNVKFCPQCGRKMA